VKDPARADPALKDPAVADPAVADPAVTERSSIPIVPVSALTGAGLRDLVTTTVTAIADRYGSPAPDQPLVTRARHRRALDDAHAELTAFVDAWRHDHLPAPVAAVHLRAAATALEDIIGAIDVEDVLGRVFATFCVGK
jgi:tRNA modification GTPase